MARGVSAISGIAPVAPLQGFVNSDPFATPEDRNGYPANPKHGIPGEVSTPYPWEVFPGETHGPYGQENGLLSAFGIAVLAEPAGSMDEDPTADFSPRTHARPWPKGVPQSVQPDEVSARRQESLDIHSSDMGGSREAFLAPTLLAQNDTWEGFTEENPGSSLQQPIPQQTMNNGGWGSRDRVQSNAPQNQYGFDTAHMRRRWATGEIPGNNLWMRPGGRPLVKSIPGTARVPVGQDSPFAGQVPGEAYNSYGAALQDLPVQYTAGPAPALAPSYDGSGAVPAIALW